MLFLRESNQNTTPELFGFSSFEATEHKCTIPAQHGNRERPEKDATQLDFANTASAHRQGLECRFRAIARSSNHAAYSRQDWT